MIQFRAARDQRQRIKIALHRQAFGKLSIGPARIDRLVQPERIHPGFLRIGDKLAARPLGKADDRKFRMALAQGRHDPRGRRDHPSLELRR